MGMRTSPIDGRPIERPVTTREVEETAKLEGFVVRGMDAEHKLDSDEGKFFLTLIQGLLEDRVNQLVETDIQSQTILRVLDRLGMDVAAGRAASERLVKSRLRFTGLQSL